MGEARQRSRNRKEILAAATRCVYCDNPAPTEIEHMPPRGLFRDKERPAGWEFACCSRCNQGSRGADAVAQMLSLVDPLEVSDWKSPQFRRLLTAVRRYAPAVLTELFGETSSPQPVWIHHDGLRFEAMEIRASGPATVAHLDVFAAKVAMATFAELVGRPMNMDGVVFTQWILNSGVPSKALETLLSIFPDFTHLKQGQKTSGSQFELRYNTDEKSIVGALISLHGSLSIILFASDGAEFVEWFSESLTDLVGPNRPGARLTRPGLLELEALARHPL